VEDCPVRRLRLPEDRRLYPGACSWELNVLNPSQLVSGGPAACDLPIWWETPGAHRHTRYGWYPKARCATVRSGLL